MIVPVLARRRRAGPGRLHAVSENAVTGVATSPALIAHRSSSVTRGTLVPAGRSPHCVGSRPIVRPRSCQEEPAFADCGNFSVRRGPGLASQRRLGRSGDALARARRAAGDEPASGGLRHVSGAASEAVRPTLEAPRRPARVLAVLPLALYLEIRSEAEPHGRRRGDRRGAPGCPTPCCSPSRAAAASRWATRRAVGDGSIEVGGAARAACAAGGIPLPARRRRSRAARAAPSACVGRWPRGLVPGGRAGPDGAAGAARARLPSGRWLRERSPRRSG